LSHAIVVGEIYEKRREDNQCSLEKIRDNGLATDFEYAFVKGKNTGYKYAAPLIWFVDYLGELKSKKLFGINDGTLSALSPAASLIFVERSRIFTCFATRQSLCPTGS